MDLKQKLAGYRVILASQSPRRQELLAGLDIAFEVQIKDGIDESYPQELKKHEIVKYLAQHKAKAYLPDLKDNELLITADTIVWVEDEVLGKPTDRQDAARMLKLLSGKEHFVLTGVSICTTDRERTFYDVSKVHFRDLTESEINYYIENYKPFDKAGAYGIQEWIGYIGIDWIEGSYFNIMGLPVQHLYDELEIMFS
jgi:septum formation protein